jgi:hypothetical protein
MRRGPGCVSLGGPVFERRQIAVIEQRRQQGILIDDGGH